MTRGTNPKIGIQNFKRISKVVLRKLEELRDYNVLTSNSIKRFTRNSDQAIRILRTHEHKAFEQHRWRVNWQFTGLIAKIIGAIIAIISVWLLETPVPTLVKAITVGGTVIKIANAYIDRKNKKAILKTFDEFLTSENWSKLQEHEALIEARISTIIKILKDLYGDGGSSADISNGLLETSKIISNETELKYNARTPLLISALKAAKKIASVQDKLHSAIEHTAEFGIESLEVAEHTYDAALTGFGEIVPFGLFELIIRAISLFLSSYELHRLIGSEDSSGPVVIRIREQINGHQEKILAYRDALRSIDLFMALRVS